MVASLFELLEPSVQHVEIWERSVIRPSGFSPPETRITNPGLIPDCEKPTAQGQKTTAEILASLIEVEKQDLPELTPSDVTYYKTSGSVAEFYQKFLSPWRARQLSRGEVTRGTLTNERQSIRCFSDFDIQSVPKGWPSSCPWNGRPIGCVTSQYVSEWLTHRLQYGTRSGPLSEGSIPKRWNHLRFVLNWGFKLGVLPQQVSLSVPAIVDRHRSDFEADTIDDLIPTAYTEQQLQAVYEQLDGDLELQTAWVLGAFTGPRSGDLFAMRWQRNIRLSAEPADMVYIPEKTRRKRRHIWCPLGSIVIDHLKRLARQQAHLAEPQGLVFPRLTDANRKNHEDGENSRARTRRIKRALADAGVPDSPDTERPWQMLRATANSRLNDCETGMGDRATHGAKPSVQGAFYTDYRDPLLRATQKLDAQRLAAGVFRRR